MSEETESGASGYDFGPGCIQNTNYIRTCNDIWYTLTHCCDQSGWWDL